MKNKIIDFKRQTLIFDPSNFEDKSVAIVGLGNIGSHATLAIARLGIKNMVIYDFDHVEAHNLASQAYDTDDLDVTKVRAIVKKVRKINGDINIIGHEAKFDPKNEIMPVDVVVIAVDSMKERKKIAKMYTAESMPKLLIDARVGGNQLEVYNILSLAQWESTFSDKPSSDPCGGRYISYVSLMVAGVIANQIKKFFNEQKMDENMIVDANSLQVVKNINWK